MKRFRRVRKGFALFGISPKQLRCNRQSAIIFSLFCLTIILSIVYLIFNANTFLEYTINIFVTSTLFAVWIGFMAILSQKKKLFNLMNKWEEIFDEKSKDLVLKVTLNKVNRQVKKWCKFGEFVIVKVSPVGLIFPRAFFSYVTYFTTNSGNDAFNLPLLFWFPFDCKNPLGYFVAVTLEFRVAVACFTLVFAGLFFGISHYLFIVAIIDNNLKNDLKLINENAASKRNRSLTLNILADFITTHSIIRRNQHIFSKIYQILVILAFSWSLVTICSVMLLIQMQIQNFDSLILLSVYIAYAFGISACVCEFSQLTSNAFEEIGDEIEILDWYLWPHEIQRMLPVILMGNQKSVELECFGSITATRETTASIMNVAFSYFMTMRQFIK